MQIVGPFSTTIQVGVWRGFEIYALLGVWVSSFMFELVGQIPGHFHRAMDQNDSHDMCVWIDQTSLRWSLSRRFGQGKADMYH